MTSARTVTAHTLANAVKVNGAVYYQPPEGGPKKLLVSAAELNEQRMTQDRWIQEQREHLEASDA